MTLEEFRHHKFLAVEWRNLMRTSGILQRVLQVMNENHPCRFIGPPNKNGDVSQVQANLELGFVRGYSKYEGGLLYLAEPPERIKDPGEPTYADPRPEEIK